MKDPIPNLPYFCFQFSSQELAARVNLLEEIGVELSPYMHKESIIFLENLLLKIRGLITIKAIDTKPGCKKLVINPNEEISKSEHFLFKLDSKPYFFLKFDGDKPIIETPHKLNDAKFVNNLSHSFNVLHFKYEIHIFLMNMLQFLITDLFHKKSLVMTDISIFSIIMKLQKITDDYLLKMSALSHVCNIPEVHSIVQKIFVDKFFVTGREPMTIKNYDDFLYVETKPSIQYCVHRDNIYNAITKNLDN